ncbi:MAG: DUF4105 domain-containing protein [Paludibacter sp.]
MRKIFLIIIIFTSILKINAQQTSISDSAIISLITCSPGQEVYSIFGHTAIRVKDATTGVDIVFNYGVFSFETENFYYKFIKGETDYQLGVYNTSIFLPEYAQRKSMVWEQVLNLNPIEKRRLITTLENNYKPENRIYRYNFAFDNCSTRPRDKITSAMFGFIKFPTTSDSKTFRQWIGVYTGNDTWLKFGIDIIFGLEADKTTSTNESMFLPEVLMTEFQSAQVTSLNGANRKLVSETNILVDNNQPEANVVPWYFKPITFSVILLIAGTIITLWDKKRRRQYKPFDTGILILTGLGGLIIFYLMVFSSHPLVKYNLNLLWLNPLNLVVAIVLWIRPLRAYLFAYQFLNIALLIGALFAFALSAQAFNFAAFPLIVLLLMRATSWFAYTKKRLYKHKEKMKH